MNKSEKIKHKQARSAIDYRRQDINSLLTQIQELLKKIKEINNMPENLINEKVIEDKARRSILKKWMRD